VPGLYNPSGSTSREIAADIERAIALGSLRPGDPLPSVRQVASLLGVSPTTAAAAYADLRRRGMVVGRPRRRATVSARPPISTPTEFTAPPGARDLASGNPDAALLPPLRWALEQGDFEQRLYGAETMLGDLLELARADFEASGVDPGELVVVNGAMDGIERILSAHLLPGDRVLVEDPTHAGIIDLVRSLMLVPVGVPLDDDGPLSDETAAALGDVRAAILTPRAQNPTGAAISRARSRELARAFAEHPDVVLVENDHSGQLAGAPHFPIRRRDGHWAVVRSVSKTLSPDLRLGFAAGDPDTVARVHGRQLLGAGWVSLFSQEIVSRLWRDPRVAGLLATARETYAERRQAAIDALAAHGITAYGRSGLNVWFGVRSEAEPAQALLGRGWALKPGAPYRLLSPPFLRITTATLETGEAEELAADVAAVLRPAHRTKLA
jgi:DNA-binding transcriptional MocR family regulator